MGVTERRIQPEGLDGGRTVLRKSKEKEKVGEFIFFWREDHLRAIFAIHNAIHTIHTNTYNTYNRHNIENLSNTREHFLLKISFFICIFLFFLSESFYSFSHQVLVLCGSGHVYHPSCLKEKQWADYEARRQGLNLKQQEEKKKEAKGKEREEGEEKEKQEIERVKRRKEEWDTWTKQRLVKWRERREEESEERMRMYRFALDY